MENLQYDETRRSHRELNNLQRKSLRKILRFYRERNDYSGCTSVRFELTRPFSHNFYSLTVRTRRSDCDRNSVRAMACKQYGHFHIGPRGAIKVHSANSGTTVEAKYVRKMVS